MFKVPSRLKELALLSQLVAISVMLPLPVLLVVGPFFLWMLSYAFLGLKWSSLYVAIDALVQLPQYVGVGSGGGTAAPAVASIASPGSPVNTFLVVQHPVLIPILLVGAVGVLSILFYVDLHLAWQNVKRIRARVPWATSRIS